VKAPWAARVEAVLALAKVPPEIKGGFCRQAGGPRARCGAERGRLPPTRSRTRPRRGATTRTSIGSSSVTARSLRSRLCALPGGRLRALVVAGGRIRVRAAVPAATTPATWARPFTRAQTARRPRSRIPEGAGACPRLLSRPAQLRSRLLRAGRVKEGIEELTKAQAQNAGSSPIHGSTWASPTSGKPDMAEAIAQFEQMVRLAPGEPISALQPGPALAT